MAPADPDSKPQSKGKVQDDSPFMFIEFSAPAKPGPKGTKKRRGGPSEVRAHITKQYHRRLRVKRQEGLAGKTLGSGSGANFENVMLPQRPRTPRDHANFSLAPSQGSTDRGSTTVDSSDVEVVSPVEHHEVVLSRSLSPALQTPLGAGRLDPFNALPVHGLPLVVHRILDHALIHSWPRTMPARSKSALNPVKAAWFGYAMETPLAFHSFIYATSMHLLSEFKGREIIANGPTMRLSHKLRTIALIKEALSATDESEPPADVVLMAILVLAVHGSRDHAAHFQVTPQVHPRSPLAEAQNLHVYGDMVHDETHLKWIQYIVAQKGGLDKIKMYGIADVISLCDIYFASKYVCRPGLPPRQKHESLVASGKHLLDATAIKLDSKLGTGFQYLESAPHGHEFLSVLEAFCELTVALDHHHRRGPTAPDLVDLVAARNSAQHRLLCLLPPPQSNFLQGERSVLHACLLATMIYSDMVIFPIPAIQGVKHRLAPLLRQTLQACSIVCDWELFHGETLLWATAMGAIAASYSSDRAWYIERIVHHVEGLGIHDRSALEAICTQFLWWKPVCNEPLEQLWMEVLFASATGSLVDTRIAEVAR